MATSVSLSPRTVTGRYTALQSSTESSIRATQERSKQEVTGHPVRSSVQKIDEQTEALVEMIGENQIDYRFFLGSSCW